METDYLRTYLKENFAYDLWANQRWRNVFTDDAYADSIWAHIYRSQTIWYARCLEEAPAPEEKENVFDSLAEINRLWQELLDTCDPTAYVSYTSREGESLFRMLEEIARHVSNHATYHRGQLREYAEKAGLEFPETDWILWKFETDEA